MSLHREFVRTSILKSQAELPKDFDFPFDIQSMKVGGIETNVTTATTPNATHNLFFIKGFKSNPFLYRDFIKDALDQGINICLVTLPSPGDKIGYIEDYSNILRAVLVDGELDQLLPTNLERQAGMHSTSGMITTKLLTSQSDAERIKERYPLGLLMVSPYFGNTYHSKGPLAPIARLYSQLFQNSAVGTTRIERLRGKDVEDDEIDPALNVELDDVKDSTPYHKQVIYMHKPTHDLRQSLKTDGFPEIAKQIPIKFFISDRDKLSDGNHAREVGRYLDLTSEQIVEISGGHSAVRKKPDQRAHFFKHAKSMTQDNKPSPQHNKKTHAEPSND